MNKPRIMMVIGQYYPIVGGAERQAQKQAELLVSSGHQVSVLTIHRSGLKRNEVINGVKVIRVRGILYKQVKLYSSVFSLYLQLVRLTDQYDVIHVHQALLPAVAASWASSKSNKPVLIKIAVSGEDFDLKLLGENFLFGKKLVSFVLKHTSRFVAIAPNIVDELQEAGVQSEKISLIPNGVEEFESQSFAPLKKETFEIVVVSRLSEQKNLFFLLDVAKDLNFPFRIQVFGQGDQEEQIQQEIVNSNLQDKVFLRGKVKPVDLKQELAKCDVFALCSKFEGLSNALLEALAMGKASVVSNIPGNTFALGDKLSEELALPLNVETWVSKLEALYKNRDEVERLGKLSKERASYFHMTNTVEKYLKLYGELL